METTAAQLSKHIPLRKRSESVCLSSTASSTPLRKDQPALALENFVVRLLQTTSTTAQQALRQMTVQQKAIAAAVK
jgi:hypothetical protein